jgi:hypothetical protein
MSVQRADLMGTRHTLNITYQTEQETLYTAATTLATSEPATATFSYTVASGDLPTYDGVPFSQMFIAFVFAAGQNTRTASATLCYRIKKNSTSIATATNLTVTASQYWTLAMRSSSMQNIVAGDVLEVLLWQSTANLTGALTWDYQAYCVDESRLKIERDSDLIANLALTISGTYPAFTAGTASIESSSGIYFYPTTGSSNYAVSGTAAFPGFKQDATYNVYRLNYNDITTTAELLNNATARPRYRNHHKITKIEWTPTNIQL